MKHGQRNAVALVVVTILIMVVMYNVLEPSVFDHLGNFFTIFAFIGLIFLIFTGRKS